MFTLVYIKNQFNRPDTLLPFLQSNVGKSPLLQVDCITPYQGTEKDLQLEVCKYLSGIDPQIRVSFVATQNFSSEIKNNKSIIHFAVIQVFITQAV